MRKFILSLGSALLVVLCIFYISNRTIEDIKAPEAISTPTASLLPEVKRTTLQPSPVLIEPTATAKPVITPATTPSLVKLERTVPPVSSQPVANVIRNLETPPDDWREFNPETLTLRLYGETEVSFTRISYSETAKHTTWIGRNDETSGVIVAVANHSTWNAEVNFEWGNSYRVISGRKAMVSEAAPLALNCFSTPSSRNRSAASDLPSLLALERVDKLTDADLDNMNIVTVAVMYDEDTEASALSLITSTESDITAEELIEANVQASLELANYYVLLSEINNLEWELAGVSKIPAYTRNDDQSMNADLDVAAYPRTPAGIAARAFFTEMKADQGVLIVGGERDSFGLGETPGNYSVVAWDHYEYLSVVMAHELGHNFGCNHDRVTEEAPANNGLFAYGHTLTVEGDTLGTIMSYEGEYLLPYYSNPLVSFEGVPTGVAADQPNAADNVRQIREQAAVIANFRLHDNDPRITQHPSGRNATPGQSISLSVSATGPDLRYQWYKDDEPITGATTETLALNATTTDDSGAYIVTVANHRTTATSTIAYVNIRAATVSSGGSTSGGGGGGGGSPSLWFSGAIALLFTARMIRNRH